MSLEQIDFGKRSGFKIPRVNIGGMRLPQDHDEAVELLRYAIDKGMKYIDTSRGYGESEIKIGKALKDGYREKVILSTKWSPFIIKPDDDDAPTADCTRKRIEEQMKRLDVDYLDFYQLWNIMNPEQYEAMTKKGGMLDGIQKAMAEGIVGHTGITSHDTPENLLRYIGEMDWCEVLLVSYNIMNNKYAGVLQKAHEAGIGTIVMNPVAGGNLTEDTPVFDDLVASTGSASLADLAVRYIHHNGSVATTISGISKKSDVDAVVASAQQPALTEEQYRSVVDKFKEMHVDNLAFCTGCKYCMPCPRGVNIPAVMEAIHFYRNLKMETTGKNKYDLIGKAWVKGNKADACVHCNDCMAKCTQKLNIPQEMDYAKEVFGQA